MKTCAGSLRALLTGIVDYAGLFPPAKLPLKLALENYSDYASGKEAWMLGCFVLPTTKLSEAGSMLAGRSNDLHSLRISALGSKVNSAEEFSGNLRERLQEAADILRAHGDTLAIAQFEAPLPAGLVSAVELGIVLAAGAELIGSLLPSQPQVFWEIPFCDDLPTIMSGIAKHNAHGQPFGVKLRTGGTDAAAFPTCAQLADALLAARHAGIAVKFTAGLHHPVRRFDAGFGTRMHGFLNVFAAGILGHEHRLDAAETRDILEDERPESFRFDAGSFCWRGRRVPTGALAAHREFATSFGSCSFDEPRDGLRELGLL